MNEPLWRLLAGATVFLVIAGAAVAYAYSESGTERFKPGIARMDAYSIGPAPNDLTLYFSTGAGDRADGPTITQDPLRISVTVRTLVYIPPRGAFKDLAARLQHVTVRLAEPLGDRTVVDASTGNALPRRSPLP